MGVILTPCLSLTSQEKIQPVNNWRPVVTTRQANANFVVKVGYFILVPAALIFVSMLFLTLH
jgi:hypothetical protein